MYVHVKVGLGKVEKVLEKVRKKSKKVWKKVEKKLGKLFTKMLQADQVKREKLLYSLENKGQKGA